MNLCDSLIAQGEELQRLQMILGLMGAAVVMCFSSLRMKGQLLYCLVEV